MKPILKITWNVLLWSVLCFASWNYTVTIYIFFQAKGQLLLLANTQSFKEYESSNELSETQKNNLRLIEAIKKYSVDSLAYHPTENFTSIYDQKESPLLWVVSASDKYKIEPYYWRFPIVGQVSYKGFFEQQKALAEKNRLLSSGYDVDLRSVSAWSTLGWFSDPVLSNMLNRSKGNLCNLIFHELFHATYYAQSSVDFNENLASFIAHKATLKFLRNDSASLNNYRRSYNDNLVIQDHMAIQLQSLNSYYDSISTLSEAQKNSLKLRKLNRICMSLDTLKLNDSKMTGRLKNSLRETKNAWFVDFRQYNGLQDSLEGVFNKFYQCDIRKMVQSLK